MLNTIKSWLEQEQNSHRSNDLKLSISKLMFGMIMVDEHVDEYEMDAILHFLTDNFNLTTTESKLLVQSICDEMNDDKLFSHAADDLGARYSTEERAYILSIIWYIALVDGKVSFREEQYINQLSVVLNVPEDMLVRLKKEQEKSFPALDERERYEEF